jgi:hypothetical protein
MLSGVLVTPLLKYKVWLLKMVICPEPIPFVGMGFFI